LLTRCARWVSSSSAGSLALERAETQCRCAASKLAKSHRVLPRTILALHSMPNLQVRPGPGSVPVFWRATNWQFTRTIASGFYGRQKTIPFILKSYSTLAGLRHTGQEEKRFQLRPCCRSRLRILIRQSAPTAGRRKDLISRGGRATFRSTWPTSCAVDVRSRRAFCRSRLRNSLSGAGANRKSAISGGYRLMPRGNPGWTWLF
jgi:hypothetical protein